MSTCPQSITVRDITAPVITCPIDVTIDCPTLPTPANTGGPATATDVCDASPVITFTDGVSTPGACPGTYSFVRTWKATDACNNMSTCPQSITVRDITAPVITCPIDVTIDCPTLPTPANTGGPATATDVCDASPVITFTDGVSTPGACPGTYSFVRTWKATDACNNMSTCPQSITVRDITAPVITCPIDVTIDCPTLPTPANTGGPATATDVCDASPVITFTDGVSTLEHVQVLIVL
ncbi:MAG: hypothetical protein IPP06_06295 [Saprospiraceae bacterium]|nr:hypothetical protein [Candidatus Vicinibacter affinis]